MHRIRMKIDWDTVHDKGEGRYLLSLFFSGLFSSDRNYGNMFLDDERKNINKIGQLMQEVRLENESSQAGERKKEEKLMLRGDNLS